MLPVSLDFPFLIAPSVSSNVYIYIENNAFLSFLRFVTKIMNIIFLNIAQKDKKDKQLSTKHYTEN